MLSTLILAMYLSFVPATDNAETAITEDETSVIQWISLDEAVSKSKKKEKLFMIDFYTDWCGWCKKLDSGPYADPEVIKYVNENFYAIKINAEQKEDIEFNGKTYSYKSNGGRGTNDIAMMYAARNGRLGYPTISFITADGDKVGVEPGFKDATNMMVMLKFYAEDHYKTMDFTTYKAKATQDIQAD